MQKWEKDQLYALNYLEGGALSIGTKVIKERAPPPCPKIL